MGRVYDLEKKLNETVRIVDRLESWIKEIGFTPITSQDIQEVVREVVGSYVSTSQAEIIKGLQKRMNELETLVKEHVEPKQPEKGVYTIEFACKNCGEFFMRDIPRSMSLADFLLFLTVGTRPCPHCGCSYQPKQQDKSDE